MQFREKLADRQAAEAVRARIDWKYLLGLEITDPGFDFSVLSEFRDRLLAGSAEGLLLEKLLERCRALGLLKARGQQRTDSTHVLAAIRVLKRFELVTETLRAALNDVATVAPAWLQRFVPLEWYERYGKRIEETRLPREPGRTRGVCPDGRGRWLPFLDASTAPEAPPDLRELPTHRDPAPGVAPPLRTPQGRRRPRQGTQPTPRVRLKTNRRNYRRAAEGIESPYDPEARYRHKRDDRGRATWSTSAKPASPRPPTCSPMSTRRRRRSMRPCVQSPSSKRLVDKDLPPGEHLVDAAYIRCRTARAAVSKITASPYAARPARIPAGKPKWQGRTRVADFVVDWEHQQVQLSSGENVRPVD